MSDKKDNIQTESIDESGKNLGEFWRIFKAHWKLTVSLVVIFAIAAFAYFRLTFVPMYRSNVRFTITPLVSGDSSSGASVYNFNYMQITTFGRFYFITDIRSIGNNRWEISGHVDVLNTYASGILNNDAVIKRQQNLYNLYLNDPDFLTYNYDRIQTKKFTPVSGFHKQLTYRLIINGS